MSDEQELRVNTAGAQEAAIVPAKPRVRAKREPAPASRSSLVGRDAFEALRQIRFDNEGGGFGISDDERVEPGHLVGLEQALSDLAKRTTFDVERELKKAAQRSVNPKHTVSPAIRARPLVGYALGAHTPGVLFPPHTQALISRLVAEGYLADGQATAKAYGWHDPLRSEHRQQMEFFERLWQDLRGDDFRRAKRARAETADRAERSLNRMVDAAMRAYPAGLLVVAADLYAYEVSPNRSPHQSVDAAVEGVRALLTARERFVKQILNGKEGILAGSEWFIVPGVSGRGCPYLTVWVFVDASAEASLKDVKQAVSAGWAGAAGKNALCITYQHDGYIPRRSAPTELLRMDDKLSIRKVRKALRTLSGKLAWVLPELPNGSRSFWRSERVHADGKKKHNWGAAAMSLRRDEVSKTRRKVKQKNLGVVQELKSIERVVPTENVSRTPAAFGGDDDLPKIHDQKAHEAVLVQKIQSDDLLTELDAIRRKLAKIRSGAVDRVTVPANRMDPLSNFIPQPLTIDQMAYVPRSGLFGPDVPLAPPPIPQYPPANTVMEQGPWGSHDPDRPQAAPPIPHYPPSVPVVGQDTPPTANLTASNVGVGDGGEGTSNSPEGGVATSLKEAMSRAAKRLAEE